MRPVIFVDMDDVLVDFHDAAMVALGKTEPTKENWPKGEYDILKVLDISLEEFNSILTEEFYATLPMAPHAHLLLTMLEGIDAEICILTCPYKFCTTKGKLLWLKKHLLRFIRSGKYILTPEKRFCALPHAILIDDCDKNIAAFRAAGGQGIVFPQPWNCKHKIKGYSQKVNYILREVDFAIKRINN